MKIALWGYGKMGKAVEEEALCRGHEISHRIDLDKPENKDKLHPDNTDIIIEFTHPESFQSNLEFALSRQIPMVSGTTGWYDQLELIKQKVEQEEGSFLYSPNFSVGVNILFKLNQVLARLMNAYPEYDCFIEEQHHRFKADSPSGTAIALANQVLSDLDRKSKLCDEELRHRAPEDHELSVGFVRAGSIFGTHKVVYNSEVDQITISHQAFSRRGFALGAVIGAEWLAGKKGFHQFADIFEV